MLRTMSHEMIHMAKQMSPGYCERYSDVIFDNVLSENDVERIAVAAPIKIGEVDYYMGVMPNGIRKIKGSICIMLLL